MSKPEFGNFPGDDASIPELVDYVVMLQKTVELQLGGNLDSTNAREFGGWHIGREELASKSGMVGLSTATTGSNDLRIWAGDTNRNNAAFRVYEDGFVFLSKMLLQTRSTYPRIALDSEANEFSIFSNSSAGIRIVVEPAFDYPQIIFTNGLQETLLGQTSTDFFLAHFGQDLNIQATRNIRLRPGTGTVIVDSWNDIYSEQQAQSLMTVAINANEGIQRADDALDEIDRIDININEIANRIDSLDARVSDLEAGSP